MNNQPPQQETVTQNVLNKIRTGEIHMTSKNYFRIKLGLLIGIIFSMLVTSSFLFSYILFSLKAGGQLFLLGFGFQGFLLFFLTFPWFLLFIDIVLVIILEWFLKKFKLGYQYPFSQVLGAMLIVTIILGELLNLFAIHQALLRQEQQKKLPVIGSFYKNIRRPPHQYGAYRGRVMSISNNSFVLQDDDKDSDDAATSTETVTVPGIADINSLLYVGDIVFVAGTINNGVIQAYGIRKLSLTDEQ